MSYKQFDKKLHEIWDPFAKKNARKIIKDISKGCVKFKKENIDESFNKFDKGTWDQKYFYNGKEIFVEAEAKGCNGKDWFGIFADKDYPFFWKDMHFSIRKNKNIAQFFIVVSAQGNFAFLVQKKHINRTIRKDTNISKDESFLSACVSSGRFLFKTGPDSEGREWHIWVDKKHYRKLINKYISPVLSPP